MLLITVVNCATAPEHFPSRGTCSETVMLCTHRELPGPGCSRPALEGLTERVGSEADQKVDAYTEQAVRGLCVHTNRQPFMWRQTAAGNIRKMLRRLMNLQTKKKKEKKRTFGTVMDENQGWILSGESGHWEQRLLALHLRHDSCFSQIAKGSASQGWVGLRESETNGNYDIPEQKGREDMFTSRLYNVKQREALDSRRLQHLLKGISHLAHKNWVSAAFHLCVYAIMRQEHPKFTRDL